MNWLWQGILRFGSPLLVLTVVACGGSGSRLLVLTPSQPPSEVVPQPDPTSQANFEKLVASWPTALLDGGVFVIPAGRFVFPAGLARLSLIVQSGLGYQIERWTFCRRS
jgi:hypothetical protein